MSAAAREPHFRSSACSVPMPEDCTESGQVGFRPEVPRTSRPKRQPRVRARRKPPLRVTGWDQRLRSTRLDFIDRLERHGFTRAAENIWRRNWLNCCAATGLVWPRSGSQSDRPGGNTT
jgi:hypothetical protein